MMQLTYALITPYTIRKSRTGAVLSRLLGRAKAELVCSRMFAPDQELVRTFAESIGTVPDARQEEYRRLIREYILENFSPSPDGHPHRTLMLVFRGEDAREEIGEIIGRLRISAVTGETVRDAYGDLVRNNDGSVRYFEPAVIIPDRDAVMSDDLECWLKLADRQPEILENVIEYAHPDKVQQTLVLLKPDSWRQSSSRPGAIVDMFSRTGLRIIGCKRVQFSLNQALQFYGPVKQALCGKLAPGIGRKSRSILEQQFGIHLPEASEVCLEKEVGIPYAINQFERIVEFMSGRRPSTCPADLQDEPGTVKCMALVYEGEDAVAKIRDVLGPTDPTKAPLGTVRREFGSDVMVNTAHASDSPQNAEREMEILRIKENTFADEVRTLLRETEHEHPAKP